MCGMDLLVSLARQTALIRVAASSGLQTSGASGTARDANCLSPLLKINIETQNIKVCFNWTFFDQIILHLIWSILTFCVSAIWESAIISYLSSSNLTFLPPGPSDLTSSVWLLPPSPSPSAGIQLFDLWFRSFSFVLTAFSFSLALKNFSQSPSPSSLQ